MRLSGKLIEASRDAGTSTRPSSAGSLSEGLDRGILLAELTMEDDPMREVTDALHRIQAGAYGICEQTHRVISPDRLRALPWTRYCREAAPAAWEPLR